MKICTTNDRAALKTALLILIGAAVASAETNPWRNIGPEGGPIQALAIDPNNPATIYASSYNVGIAFKSVNGGGKWIESNAPNRVLVFDPQDPNIIYAIDSLSGSTAWVGVFKSVDGGASWNPSNSGLPASHQVFALAIDPHNSSTLYVGGIGGIFKSTDGGATWSSSSYGVPKGYPEPKAPDGHYPYVFSIVIDPQDSQTLYAVSDPFNASPRLLFKITDEGDTSYPATSSLSECLIVLAIDT